MRAMRVSPSNRFSAASLALLCLLLAGCVTETTGGRQVEVSDEDRVRALINLAVGYIETEDLDRAKTTLQRADEVDGNNWEVQNLFGQVYQIEGETDLAERYYRRAVRIAPQSTRARNDLGVFLYYKGDFDDAVRELERAVENPENPQRAMAYENLGMAALAADQISKARNAFARAIMLDDDRPLALLELTELALREANYAEANAYYNRFRELSRQSPRSLLIGIELARAVENRNDEASFALQLRNMYPYSDEYRRYREMTGVQ